MNQVFISIFQELVGGFQREYNIAVKEYSKKCIYGKHIEVCEQSI